MSIEADERHTAMRLRRIAWPVIGLLGGFMLACSGLPLLGSRGAVPSGYEKYVHEGEPKSGIAVPAELGQWQKGFIDCSQKRCNSLYSVELKETGRLFIDVYAPWGDTTPDFGVELLDADALVLAQTSSPGERPRRLRASVSAGRYVVRIHALESGDPRLTYDLITRFERAGKSAGRVGKPTRTGRSRKEPSKPVTPTTRAVVERPTPSPPTESEPVSGGNWVDAEVLDVELHEGTPSAVLLDAGEPQGVAVGMRGRLRDGSALIGQFEVIDVFQDGSRARIVGELSSEIGVDTRAEISVSPPRSSP